MYLQCLVVRCESHTLAVCDHFATSVCAAYMVWYCGAARAAAPRNGCTTAHTRRRATVPVVYHFPPVCLVKLINLCVGDGGYGKATAHMYLHSRAGQQNTWQYMSALHEAVHDSCATAGGSVLSESAHGHSSGSMCGCVSQQEGWSGWSEAQWGAHCVQPVWGVDLQPHVCMQENGRAGGVAA